MAAPQNGSPTLQFSASKYEMNRHQHSSAYIPVIRMGDSAGEVSVVCTAREGQTPRKTETLTFAAQETYRIFAIPIPVRLPDSDMTISLELSNPQNATLGQPEKADLIIRSFQSRFVTLFKSRPVKHIILTFVLICAIYILHESILMTVSGWGEKEFYKDLKLDYMQSMLFPKNTKLASEEQARLNDQLRQIRQLIKMHFSIMKFYYKRYVTALATFSLVAAIAAIMLILISKSGWESASEYVITTFLITTAASIFIGSWPSLFQHDQNITGNKVLYLKYRTLENEVLSYPVTNEALNYTATSDDLKKPSNPGEAKEESPQAADPGNARQSVSKVGIPLSAKDFIHHVDLQLSQDNIAIGFDYSKLPNYKDVFTTK